MKNTVETTPANWDKFIDILGACSRKEITEQEMESKTSLFSNEEELWQFFLTNL